MKKEKEKAEGKKNASVERSGGKKGEGKSGEKREKKRNAPDCG